MARISQPRSKLPNRNPLQSRSGALVSTVAGDTAPRTKLTGVWLAGVLRETVGRLKRIVWRHPEWWALGLALFAWGVLIANAGGFGTRSVHAHRHHLESLSTIVLVSTAHWQLMVLAMMLPVVVPSLRVAAFRSLWRRRHR